MRYLGCFFGFSRIKLLVKTFIRVSLLDNDMADTCHQCGNEYKEIGKHWSWSECDYESLSQHQHEVVVGLLMGDGGLNWSNDKPYVQVAMTTPNYLEYLSQSIFPTCSGNVALIQTAADCAERDRNSGMNPTANKENYSDLYKVQTMSHPDLTQYNSWYSTGKKVFPPDIELTPTTLKHWYCGDGSLIDNGASKIALHNERKNEDKIKKVFRRVGLTISNWYSGGSCTNITFRGDEAEAFFNYIGEPLPDFSRKWPEQRC